VSNKKTYTIYNEDEIKPFVDELLKDLKYQVVLFIGELGAGKTTIIKQILKTLGSEDAGSSPSYAIINEYKAAVGPVFHIDLYRLNSADEVFQLGFEDIIYSGNRCFIEWPQIVIDYIDQPYHILSIEVESDKSRKISLS